MSIDLITSTNIAAIFSENGYDAPPNALKIQLPANARWRASCVFLGGGPDGTDYNVEVYLEDRTITGAEINKFSFDSVDWAPQFTATMGAIDQKKTLYLWVRRWPDLNKIAGFATVQLVTYDPHDHYFFVILSQLLNNSSPAEMVDRSLQLRIHIIP